MGKIKCSNLKTVFVQIFDWFYCWYFLVYIFSVLPTAVLSCRWLYFLFTLQIEDCMFFSSLFWQLFVFYDLFSGTCVICVFAGSYSQTRRTYKPNPSSHQSVPSDTDSTGQLFVRCWLDSQSLIKDYNSGANTNWNFQFVTCQVSFGTKTSYFLQVFYFLYGNLEV